MTVDPAALSAFRKGFSGRVICADAPDYDSARLVWNAMFDRYPAIIVRPVDSADVASAVRFAREQDLVIAVRSGGHSMSGLSTCDSGIVIDLSTMRGVRVDPESRTARANGGALLGELDHAAQARGLACPVGVVSHTGVAGLTLGGGMGRLQRKFGLTIDSLRSVDLVTAEGELIRVSADHDDDLFWGIRGAGANFGIATSFEFHLHTLDPVVVYGVAAYPIERIHDLAALVAELTYAGPRELWFSLGVGVASKDDFSPDVAGLPVLTLQVHYCGPIEAAERDLRQLRALGAALVDTIAPTTYLAAQSVHDESYRWSRRFYIKSAFMATLDKNTMDVCLEHVSRAPEGGECGFSIWSCGGAMADVSEEASAFTGRAAKFWIAAEALWDDPSLDEAHIVWGRAAMIDVNPFTMEGRYVNDVADSGEDVIRSVYGAEKYERLVTLKRRWDPENVFRLNQNIQP